MSFTLVDVCFDLPLSGPHKWVLAALLRHAKDQNAWVYPSLGRIAYLSGVHKRTVQRALAELIESGMIEKRARTPAHLGVEYRAGVSLVVVIEAEFKKQFEAKQKAKYGPGVVAPPVDTPPGGVDSMSTGGGHTVHGGWAQSPPKQSLKPSVNKSGESLASATQPSNGDSSKTIEGKGKESPGILPFPPEVTKHYFKKFAEQPSLLAQIEKTKKNFANVGSAFSLAGKIDIAPNLDKHVIQIIKDGELIVPQWGVGGVNGPAGINPKSEEPAIATVDELLHSNADPKDLSDQAIVDSAKLKPNGKYSGLAMLWKKACAKYQGNFVPNLTAKQGGQLSQAMDKIAADPAQFQHMDPRWVLLTVIRKWIKFASHVAEVAGEKSVPSVPHVGFLLKNVSYLSGVVQGSAPLPVTPTKSEVTAPPTNPLADCMLASNKMNKTEQKAPNQLTNETVKGHNSQPTKEPENTLSQDDLSDLLSGLNDHEE